MDWESIASLQLTPAEQLSYSDIFIFSCENADSVPVIKVAELLRSANVPRDVTMKILDICMGTKSSTHLRKKQFYAVLKLIAVHQAGLEVTRDVVTAPLDVIQLPAFTWPASGEEDGRRSPDLTRGAKSRHHAPESTESESEAESPRETGGSTDSPTPTNSVTQERNDSILGGETILDSVSGGWQGLLVSEEQRQLLGTEEESSERHSSDEAEGEGDGSGFPPEEVWIISDEQRDYYAAQFAQLQSDPEGLLSGPVARTFFEKSRLPVSELRRIWQLADVTRDGALSLQEFYVAMHLVVLRRNHVPLPDVLPPSLSIPLVMQTTTAAPQIPPVTTAQKSPPNSANEKNKEWTKFVDSPTGTSSSVTSPGLQLVNFDFQKSAVERDPKILHPVPLRLTPEAAILASGANGSSSSCTTLGDDDLQHSAASLAQRPLAKKPTAAPEDAVIVTPKKEPPPPPPPRPYRTHARSSSLDLNKLGKNGQSFLGAPPLVPPRISPGITSPRKLVGQRSEGEGQRTLSESQGFVADFSHFSPKSELPENTILSIENTVPQSQQFTGVCGAFQIYRKPSPKRDGGEEDNKDESEDGKQLTLQELREKNAELRLVCEELTRELASALQERINLRAKLLLLT
ncbi:ralBP1-associated Eps domain-containing protein 2 [Linepithema humile]|uniref:ralBP1-associated Eps domain-containing protein 2 n=1 Tax=Linepithema humile TaxID=83485 RepID=UPI000623112F|nr:PREDICTED: ralBP1-associated Eps domain-containing protein 2 [Linepithema humile]